MSFELRNPEPMHTASASATRGSIQLGHSAGNPTGVIRPYSIPHLLPASALGAKDALRTSSFLRTTLLTSTFVVAKTRHATYFSTSPRFPLVSFTQLPLPPKA